MQLMRSLIIRLNNCVAVLNCFSLNTSHPRPPPPAPLTCQPPVPGVFPDHVQGSGRGVPDVVAEGPPERGAQGPSHLGASGSPSALATSAPRGSADTRGPRCPRRAGSAPSARRCGSHCGRPAHTAGGGLERRQARGHIWSARQPAATRSSAVGRLRGSCNPRTRLGPGRAVVCCTTRLPSRASGGTSRL